MNSPTCLTTTTPSSGRSACFECGSIPLGLTICELLVDLFPQDFILIPTRSGRPHLSARGGQSFRTFCRAFSSFVCVCVCVSLAHVYPVRFLIPTLLHLKIIAHPHSHKIVLLY